MADVHVVFVTDRERERERETNRRFAQIIRYIMLPIICMLQQLPTYRSTVIRLRHYNPHHPLIPHNSRSAGGADKITAGSSVVRMLLALLPLKTRLSDVIINHSLDDERMKILCFVLLIITLLIEYRTINVNNVMRSWPSRSKRSINCSYK